MTTKLITSLAALLTLCFSAGVGAQTGNDKVQVATMAGVSAVQPGKPFWLAFKFTIDPEWHIYWKNPGDSGIATQVKLTLPDGFSAEGLQFPIPKVLKVGDEVNYVYQDEVTLLMKITPTKDLKTGGTIKITGKTSWLVCKENCEPGGSPVSIELPVADAATAANEELFKEWTAKLPVKNDADDVASSTVNDSLTDGNGNGTVKITWKKAPTDIQFIPGSMKTGGIAEIKAATADNASVITFNITNKKDTLPITGLVIFTKADGTKTGLEISIPSTVPAQLQDIMDK